MAPLKVAPDIKNKSVKDKRQKNSSLLSSDMSWGYSLKPVAYGVHHRGFQLVDMFEDTLY